MTMTTHHLPDPPDPGEYSGPGSDTRWREGRDEPRRTGLQLLADLERDGFLTVQSVERVEPVWAPATNRPDNLWFIFATAEDRELVEDELWLSWAELGDRCTLLNYTLRWRDVQGFGLEITHSDWAGPSGTRDRSMGNG